MAYDYTIKGNPLASGYQSGQMIGGGLRSAFKDKPAMKQALARIAQGEDANQVVRELAAQNPNAASMLMQQMQAQYETQAAPVALEAQRLSNENRAFQNQRQKEAYTTGQQIAGDDPMLKFFIDDPTAAGQIFEYNQTVDAQNRIKAGAGILGAIAMDDPTAKRNAIKESATEIKKVSPSLGGHLERIVELPDDQLDAAIMPVASIMGRMGFLPQDPRASEDRTAQMKNLEYYTELLEKDPEKAKRFAQAANLNPEERVKLAVEETQGKEEVKAGVDRVSQAIDAGMSAIKTLPSVVDAMELLDKVSTGGYVSMKQYVTDFLGVTPANEAEFAYLTGRAVLSQLKEIFGNQFTDEEGKRLERLEAGIGRSTEANRVILSRVKQMTIGAAKRGYRAAIQQGDTFTANEIARQLQQLGESVDGTPQQPQQSPSQRTPEQIESEYLGGM